MPPFGTDQVTAHDLDMVVRFLRHDYPMPGTAANSRSILATAADQPGTEVVSHRP